MRSVTIFCGSHSLSSGERTGMSLELSLLSAKAGMVSKDIVPRVAWKVQGLEKRAQL